MGGMHGMGPVEIEKDEPVSHSDREAREFGLGVRFEFRRRVCELASLFHDSCGSSELV